MYWTEIIVGMIGLLGGAVTGWFAYRGRSKETDISGFDKLTEKYDQFNTNILNKLKESEDQLQQMKIRIEELTQHVMLMELAIDGLPKEYRDQIKKKLHELKTN